MWAWLNPLNLIKLLSLFKTLIDMAVAGYQMVAGWWQKRSQQKTVEQASDAEKQIDEANKNENEAQRLKEKADAVCKMEQALDPTRRCD